MSKSIVHVLDIQLIKELYLHIYTISDKGSLLEESEKWIALKSFGGLFLDSALPYVYYWECLM